MAVFPNWSSNDSGSSVFDPWSRYIEPQKDDPSNPPLTSWEQMKDIVPADSQQGSGYFDQDSTSKVTGDQYEDVAFNPLQFAQGFAKKVAQGYGAVTDNLQKDLGGVINTAASAVAGAQPIIKKFVSSSPIVQDTASTVLNKLPVSVNLFGRYYTGLGNKGLELPQSFINDTRGAIQQNAPEMPQMLQELQKGEQSLQSMRNALLQSPVGTDSFISGMNPTNKKSLYQSVNDSLAENKSHQNQINTGNVIITDLSNSSKNPFTSLGTSLGRAVFKPTSAGGWSTNEKYDFEYGGADEKQSQNVQRSGPSLRTPSQEFAYRAAYNLLRGSSPSTDFAAANPAADFGRAVVAKMSPTSFNYNINIPPN